MKPPPEFLYRLMTTNESEAIMFRQNIRLYNSCYSLTSMGAKIDKTVNKRPGPYVFRISGQVLHRIGSLLPVEREPPAYSQLYVYDTASELLLRERTIGKEEGSPKLDQGIMLQLKDMLDEVNPLTQVFRMAQERIREDNDVQLSIRLLGSRNKKDKVYNNPTASEIAALIVSPEGSSTKGRDIVIDHKSTGLQTISELHPSYMALQYPLLFPYGEDNYHLDIPYYTDHDKPETSRRKNVTMREYYAYRIQQRISEGHIWLCGGRLFQQFLVDCCCAIESDRLWYIKNNQDLFRCDILNNICDAVEKGDLIGHAVGKRFYLPPSFTGSPRYMYQSYQDAMAICRWYGNPHLFITFTANSRWPEIEAMLKYIPNQRPEDRPDIVARVFKLKLKQLLHCLKTERYFGTTIADVYTIEFQKRGLPHAHILLWLKKEEVDLSTDYIDSIIHAEIPDKDREPALYEAVSRFMVHGSCGDANRSCPCMVNNTCSKKYPKSFNKGTTLDQNGYPVYRRRENKRTIKKGDNYMDNRSIVLYNPGLLLMFDAHINVEWCNTARAIKYLFKYIAKGPDKATLVIKDDAADEIKSYLDCRYLSASEASWRIFGFDIQERNPSVMRLPVHLEEEQAVLIRDDDILKVVLARQSNAETKVTAWMRVNEESPEARELSYAEFPTKYVWDDGWKRRKQGRCIGRISYVHPTAGERYYLRLLLNIVKGPKSYEEIRTVNQRV
ncbi:uncharacterized protein LOC141628239 [Silene latifolia]|uniref:uncharacterized protein LOC141628239 n=1 Tax=Silene latifolia TaxID=37657 RepID=UPI003D7834DD